MASHSPIYGLFFHLNIISDRKLHQIYELAGHTSWCTSFLSSLGGWELQQLLGWHILLILCHLGIWGMYCYSAAIPSIANVPRTASTTSTNLSDGISLGGSDRGLSTKATGPLYADYHRFYCNPNCRPDNAPALFHRHPQIPQEAKPDSLYEPCGNDIEHSPSLGSESGTRRCWTKKERPRRRRFKVWDGRGRQNIRDAGRKRHGNDFSVVRPDTRIERRGTLKGTWNPRQHLIGQ